MVYFAKWKVVLIVAACLLGAAFTAPNFLARDAAEGLPTWLPHKQISLGLDLQGGSHLLLEVETNEVIKEQLEALVGSVRETLRREKIFYTNLGTTRDAVRFTLRDPGEIERVRDLVDDLITESGINDGGIGNLLTGMGGGPRIAVESDSDGTVRLQLSEAAVIDRRTKAIEQSIEIIRRRIDETGTREPTIQRQGEDRILVQLPGVKDPERMKKLLGKTAKLTFHLVDQNTSPSEARAGRLPPGSMLLPTDDRDSAGGRSDVVVRKRVRVGGERLVDAQATFQDNQPVVSFRFDTLGGRQFGNTTRDNVGRQLAIVLDGRVISAPVIREPILGGSGIISGRFSVQEVQDLALLLRAGALPAPLVILEERTVGPGLGADSIAAGEIASIIGFVAVVVFMIVAYGLFGVFAVIALLFNMALIMGALSLLQATLTLPGIAGIVLTIGMAVDANVLIFERIREEMRGGRSPVNAVDAGYRRALTTIIDANITTLIASVLLFGLGSGPVKGFAVTLSIGIVTSMFTAIMVTRLIVVTWLRRRRPKALPV